MKHCSKVVFDPGVAHGRPCRRRARHVWGNRRYCGPHLAELERIRQRELEHRIRDRVLEQISNPVRSASDVLRGASS